MLTLIAVLVLMVAAVCAAEFVRSTCRRMLATPLPAGELPTGGRAAVPTA